MICFAHIVNELLRNAFGMSPVLATNIVCLANVRLYRDSLSSLEFNDFNNLLSLLPTYLATTEAPSFPKRWAIARPMPRDVSVTIATFPLRDDIGLPPCETTFVLTGHDIPYLVH